MMARATPAPWATATTTPGMWRRAIQAHPPARIRSAAQDHLREDPPRRTAQTRGGARHGYHATPAGVLGGGSALTAEHFARRVQHLGHDLPDIVVGGAVIDEARAQRESFPERRIGQVHPSALDEAPEDRCVQPISRGTRLAPAVAEAHGAELD